MEFVGPEQTTPAPKGTDAPNASNKAAPGTGYDAQAAALSPRQQMKLLGHMPAPPGMGLSGALIQANTLGNLGAGAADFGQVTGALSLRGAGAVKVLGKLTGGAGCVLDIIDIAKHGINPQNGANLLVNLSGLAPGGGPLLCAFSLGYGIGQLLDQCLGISDWIGSLADSGAAGGDRGRLRLLENLAQRGDHQCGRLLDAYRQRASREDAGALHVNHIPGNQKRFGGNSAHLVKPARLRELGRNQEVDANQREIQETTGMPGGVLSRGLAEAKTPTDDHLMAIIERENEVLDKRIAEAQKLSALEANLRSAAAAALRHPRGESVTSSTATD